MKGFKVRILNNKLCIKLLADSIPRKVFST